MSPTGLWRASWLRERSIVFRLVTLVLGLMAPLLAFAGIATVLYAQAQRNVIEAERADVTRNAVHIIDREVQAILASLQVLARSDLLREGNFSAFHRYATEVA